MEGQLNNLYYTETELDGGQLDNRYFTETELNNGALDNRYFTEAELNNGQLDTRYFRQDSSETITSGATWSGSDNYIATTAAIDARIVDLVDDVGGFVPIANEQVSRLQTLMLITVQVRLSLLNPYPLHEHQVVVQL